MNSTYLLFPFLSPSFSLSFSLSHSLTHTHRIHMGTGMTERHKHNHAWFIGVFLSLLSLNLCHNGSNFLFFFSLVIGSRGRTLAYIVSTIAQEEEEEEPGVLTRRGVFASSPCLSHLSFLISWSTLFCSITRVLNVWPGCASLTYLPCISCHRVLLRVTHHHTHPSIHPK